MSSTPSHSDLLELSRHPILCGRNTQSARATKYQPMLVIEPKMETWEAEISAMEPQQRDNLPTVSNAHLWLNGFLSKNFVGFLIFSHFFFLSLSFRYRWFKFLHQVSTNLKFSTWDPWEAPFAIYTLVFVLLGFTAWEIAIVPSLSCVIPATKRPQSLNLNFEALLSLKQSGFMTFWYRPRYSQVQTSRADINLHTAAWGLTAFKSFGEKDRQTLDACVVQLRSR